MAASPVLKEGFLLKRDDSFMFPGWKKRFCQLKSDGLFTIGDGKHVDHHFNTKIDLKKVEQGFEAESLNLPKGRADMESMFVVHAKHKKYYFLAGNSGECYGWIGSIKNSQTTSSVSRAPHSGASAPGASAPGYHHSQQHQHHPIHPQHQQMEYRLPQGGHAPQHPLPYNPNHHH